MTAALLALGLALTRAGIDPSKAIITLPEEEFMRLMRFSSEELRDPSIIAEAAECIAVSINGIKIAARIGWGADPMLVRWAVAVCAGPRSGLSRTNPPAREETKMAEQLKVPVAPEDNDGDTIEYIFKVDRGCVIIGYRLPQHEELWDATFWHHIPLRIWKIAAPWIAERLP